MEEAGSNLRWPVAIGLPLEFSWFAMLWQKEIVVFFVFFSQNGVFWGSEDFLTRSHSKHRIAEHR